MAKARMKTTRPPTQRGASPKSSEETAKTPALHSGVPLIELIERLRRGEIAADTLDPKTRVSCVEVLTTRGVSPAEIAKLFDVCDRTIRRDITKIRDRYAQEIASGGPNVIAGVLLCYMAWARENLKRICHRSDTKAADQIKAAETLLQQCGGVIDRLQSLGVLPTAPRRVEATVRGQSDELPSIEELTSEMAALEPEHLDDGGTGAVKAAVTMLAQLAGAEAINAARNKRPKSNRAADQDAA